MSNVLIVWVELPERVKFYVVPEEVAKPHVNLLKLAHGKYLNCDDSNEGLEFLNIALSEKREHCNGEAHACLFSEYERDDEFGPIDETISLVIHSGFVI